MFLIREHSLARCLSRQQRKWTVYGHFARKKAVTNWIWPLPIKDFSNENVLDYLISLFTSFFQLNSSWGSRYEIPLSRDAYRECTSADFLSTMKTYRWKVREDLRFNRFWCDFAVPVDILKFEVRKEFLRFTTILHSLTCKPHQFP